MYNDDTPTIPCPPPSDWAAPTWPTYYTPQPYEGDDTPTIPPPPPLPL